MALKLYIPALIVAAFTEMAMAQTAPTLNRAEPSQIGLSACQSLHNIPIVLSNLQGSDLTTSPAIFQAETKELYQHVQALTNITDRSLDAEKAAISNTLANLNVQLETASSTRSPFEIPIPENFDQALLSISKDLNCDQYMLETPTTNHSKSNGEPPFNRTTNENSALLETPANASDSVTYHHIQNQGLVSDASARYLARNPIKLLLDSDGRYLFLLVLLMFVSGIIYIYRRFKKFEAREPRRLLNLLIKVKLGDRIYDFYLVDLSRNGAKLNHLESIQSKGNIHVELGDQWHLGQIKWHNNLFAGIKFKTPIDVHTFSKMTHIS